MFWKDLNLTYYGMLWKLMDPTAHFVTVHAFGSIFGESHFLHWSNEISMISMFRWIRMLHRASIWPQFLSTSKSSTNWKCWNCTWIFILFRRPIKSYWMNVARDWEFLSNPKSSANCKFIKLHKDFHTFCKFHWMDFAYTWEFLTTVKSQTYSKIFIFH